MSEQSGGAEPNAVSTQLASLVPTFNPATDDVIIYQQKVELVLAAWPKNRISELITRLILNCQGTAFQKLQIHHAELLTGEEKSVQRIIELLGGQWGKIGLERQYEDAENALYHCQQRPDESNDSFLARSDVLWAKFLARKTKLEDLQPYVVLRGSLLSSEEKKKVILESDQSLEGKLTIQRVTEAIRVLGATFFSDMTGQKRTQRSKVYEQSTLLAQDDDENQETAFQADEVSESEFLEALQGEGDEDATLIADFEQAAAETLQEDPELASAYTAYQDARRRLSEKFRNRGFWPTSRSSNFAKGKGYGQGGKSSNKGKRSSFSDRPRRSLQERIMSTNCKACGRRGHWKAECPYKNAATGGTGTSSIGSTSGSMPTTTAIVDESTLHADEMLPMEFMMLPEEQTASLDEDQPKGASKTVIGSDGVKDLIQQLDAETRSRLSRVPCKITFRFGNQSTLSSSHALVIPIGDMKLKVAIVPGGTPFLLSNTFMRAIQAQINCHSRSMQSPYLQRPVPLHLTQRGLFLVDVNQIVSSAKRQGPSTFPEIAFETFVSEPSATNKETVESSAGTQKDQVGAEDEISDTDQIPTSNEIKLKNPEAEISSIFRAVTGRSLQSADMSTSESPQMSATYAHSESSHEAQTTSAAQPAALVETEDLSQLSREDLATELISFGQKHQGETFLTAWQDQEWVSFMVSRYQTSTKPAHRRFIRFVELQVEHFEQEQIPLTPGPSVVTHAMTPQSKAKSKALPKGRGYPAHRVPVDVMSEFEGEEDWEPMVNYNADSETVQAMQQRLLNMEEALMRVMRHLEDQSALQTQDK
eukprot:s3886_g6.t1